jgi:hypothetical protein
LASAWHLISCAAAEGLKRTNANVASVRADVPLKAELQAAAEEARAGTATFIS